MTVLILSVIGGLLAFELWGSIDLVAKLAIRIITAPVPEPWKGIRRAELAALVHPCKGERRMLALLRVIAIAGTLAIADIGHHRFRPVRGLELPFVWRAEDLFQEGMTSSERAPVAILYLGAMLLMVACIVVSSATAWALGASAWQIALFWVLFPFGALAITLLPIPPMVRILPMFLLVYGWAGLVLTVALLKGALVLAFHAARSAKNPFERSPGKGSKKV